MDALPFGDASFDVVTGVNGFQFALDPATALREAARVLMPGGRLAAATFAEPERNEGTALHLAMKRLVEEPEDDGYTPYSLSEPGGLERRTAAGGSRRHRGRRGAADVGLRGHRDDAARAARLRRWRAIGARRGGDAGCGRR